LVICAKECRLAKPFPQRNFDEGLGKRSAIYLPFPQAVPGENIQLIPEKVVFSF